MARHQRDWSMFFRVIAINLVAIASIIIIVEALYFFCFPKYTKPAEMYARSLLGKDLYPIRFPYVSLKKHMTISGRELFPLADASFKDSIYCNEGGYWSTYTTDRFGFVNDDSAYATYIDIMVIGDSYAQGACVDYADSSQGVLRNQGLNTVSLGMGSNGPLIELASLKEYFPFVRPRYVMWYYYEGNDLANLSREMGNPILARYFEDGYRQGLPEMQNEISAAIFREMRESIQREVFSGIDGPISYVKKYGLVGRFVDRLRGAHPESQGAKCLAKAWERQRVEEFRRVIQEARRYVETNDATLIFVYLPSYETINGSCNNEYYLRGHLLNAVAEEGISIVDFGNIARRRDDPTSIFPRGRRGHYNEGGYRELAEAVAETVRRIDASPAMRSGTIRH